MIIEHSGDFKVVDPKTKEVRYVSPFNSSGTNSSTWNYTGAEEKSPNPLEKSLSKKDQILRLLKGETFYDIKNMLEEVFEEVQEKAKY